MARVSCIGCGTVGSAWAVVFTRAGHDVVLFDKNTDLLTQFSLPLIQDTLDLINEHGGRDEATSTILSRISLAKNLAEACASADYIQESVSENLEVKRALFKKISVLSRAYTILASSTSAIKGSEFLEDITYPERALVAHPVNPPSLIPLVELCGSSKTRGDTIKKANMFLSDSGMKPIILKKEIDGFILNRLQYTLVAEAMHLVAEGYCTAADIDSAMTDGLALRWASIGPFETAHLNAQEGFQGFVDQLGPMMKNMGRLAKTDYNWTDQHASEIHKELVEKTPIDQIPNRQRWRNTQILATRKLQSDGRKT